MRTWTTTTREITRVQDAFWIRAPHLGHLVEVLFSLRQSPDNKRARIQRALLAHDGVDRCVGCQATFSLAGFSEVRTGFVERKSLTCEGCGARYLLEEHQIA